MRDLCHGLEPGRGRISPHRAVGGYHPGFGGYGRRGPRNEGFRSVGKTEIGTPLPRLAHEPMDEQLRHHGARHVRRQIEQPETQPRRTPIGTGLGELRIEGTELEEHPEATDDGEPLPWLVEDHSGRGVSRHGQRGVIPLVVTGETTVGIEKLPERRLRTHDEQDGNEEQQLQHSQWPWLSIADGT